MISQKCLWCGKNKVLDKDFHKNKFSSNGYSTICKKCRNDIKDLGKFKLYLKDNDIQFSETIYKKAEERIKDKISKQYKDKELPSEKKIMQLIIGSFLSLGNLQGDYSLNKENKRNKKYDNQDVKDDLKIKWGDKYNTQDYIKLEEFYTKMKDFNKIETPQDEFYLKKLAVISLKMDKELEEGNYAQVKQLGDLFSKYMGDSKFRAMDLTDATKSGGIRTFSQIYAEVERDDFIPPWEEYRKIKGLDQDIVDKTIMYILNYTLKLNKVPQMVTPPSDTPKIEEN